jgi:hypothetical protein
MVARGEEMKNAWIILSAIFFILAIGSLIVGGDANHYFVMMILFFVLAKLVEIKDNAESKKKPIKYELTESDLRMRALKEDKMKHLYESFSELTNAELEKELLKGIKELRTSDCKSEILDERQIIKKILRERGAW